MQELKGEQSGLINVLIYAWFGLTQKTWWMWLFNTQPVHFYKDPGLPVSTSCLFRYWLLAFPNVLAPCGYSDICVSAASVHKRNNSHSFIEEPTCSQEDWLHLGSSVSTTASQTSWTVHFMLFPHRSVWHFHHSSPQPLVIYLQFRALLNFPWCLFWQIYLLFFWSKDIRSLEQNNFFVVAW